ncbi:MAG TPA: polymer-forming cytoskeletal protein [Stellaceae bacterium]|jgi:cytoskeletal protein CcmA (bactofilin family)|nr:polymer-forming cytoskeletal protein [Stellaceae bacterium]
MRHLIVGPEISLNGEINSCDRLLVEGNVEANLANCLEVEIAETGLFKGQATVDEMELRGRFEGTLTVKKRLLIRSTGKVSGTIVYGQIEMECGGQISGEVRANPMESSSSASAPEPSLNLSSDPGLMRRERTAPSVTDVNPAQPHLN